MTAIKESTSLCIHRYFSWYIHTYKAVDILQDILTVGIFTVWTSRRSFVKLDQSLEDTLTYVSKVCIYVMYVCMYVNNKYHLSVCIYACIAIINIYVMYVLVCMYMYAYIFVLTCKFCMQTLYR